ncbi:hypothetical protein [Bradyrhizobium sp. SEMIA]|uniref:hypothetical protein n=1 Tax=Bradyrhizobium sp. SEMIA TaxID=2597515 RepID=UPI003A0FDA6D
MPLRPNPQPPGARASTEGFDEAPQANYGTAATIPTLDPELARQLGLPTEEDDAEALARPPRSKMEALGVKATADALESLIREGRPEFRKDDGSMKVWTPHRPPRPEKSEGGVRFEIKSSYEPRATSRPRSRSWSRASSATTARRCCSASPAPARPTPWPR